MKLRGARIALRVIGLAFVALLALVVLNPLPGRPDVLVTVIGHTNDTTGIRVAIVSLTNHGTDVYVYAACFKLTESNTPPGGFWQYPSPWHATLKNGESGTFTIPLPTNPPPWKVRLHAYTDIGTAQVVRRIVTARRYMPFSIESDWFDDKE